MKRERKELFCGTLHECCSWIRDKEPNLALADDSTKYELLLNRRGPAYSVVYRRPAAQPTPKGTAEVLREVQELMRVSAGLIIDELQRAKRFTAISNSAAWADKEKRLKAHLTKLRALLARLESEGE
jgi:hypothetical protein